MGKLSNALLHRTFISEVLLVRVTVISNVQTMNKFAIEIILNFSVILMFQKGRLILTRKKFFSGEKRSCSFIQTNEQLWKKKK